MPHRESRRPMASVDAAWLRMEEPGNLMTITIVLTFEGPLDPGALERLVRAQLLAYPRFRRRVRDTGRWLGRPEWVDVTDFRMADHLVPTRLPGVAGEAELRDLVDRLVSTPLDRRRPLWQIHHVENLGTGSALVVRLHHCLADGIALVQLLLSLATDTPDPFGTWDVAVPPADTSSLEPLVATLGRGLKSAVGEAMALAMDPTRAVRLARDAGRSAGAVLRLLALSPDPESPLKGPLGIPKRVAWTGALPLSRVKDLARTHGGTVNDALLAAVAGALRRHLEARGVTVPADLELRTVVPVNLRPPERMLDLGNAFGLTFLALPVGVVDPADRVGHVKSRMDRVKSSAEAVATWAVLTGLGAVSPRVEKLVVGIFGSRASMVMTNVPGPRRRMFLLGRPIRDILFWVPQSGRLGLGVSILSYAGEVRVGFAADAGLVPEPQALADAFQAEIEALSGSAARRTVEAPGAAAVGESSPAA